MCLLLGTWPTTQACALPGNRASNPLVHRSALNPLSHTSQGPKCALKNKYAKEVLKKQKEVGISKAHRNQPGRAPTGKIYSYQQNWIIIQNINVYKFMLIKNKWINMGEESNFTHRRISNHLCGYCPLRKVEFIPFHPLMWAEFKNSVWAWHWQLGTGSHGGRPAGHPVYLTLCGPSGSSALAGCTGGPSRDLLHALGSGGAPCPGSCGGASRSRQLLVCDWSEAGVVMPACVKKEKELLWVGIVYGKGK